jgi:hypothetical protein
VSGGPAAARAGTSHVPCRPQPSDAAIPAPEVPADASFTRTFVADKAILQREFTGGPGWLTGLAYAVLAAIAAGWVCLVAWGLGRFLGARPQTAVPGGRGSVVGTPTAPVGTA